MNDKKKCDRCGGPVEDLKKTRCHRCMLKGATAAGILNIRTGKLKRL